MSYFPGIDFTFMENFDNGSSKFAALVPPPPADSFKYITQSQGAFEGFYSGVINAYNYNSFMLVTDTFYVLPTNGYEVYLEMNYKTNNTFGVGVVPIGLNTYFNPDTILEIKPNTEWNKIYIDLTSDVGVYPNAIGFKIFIGGYADPGNANPEIYFDNIKLIHQ